MATSRLREKQRLRLQWLTRAAGLGRGPRQGIPPHQLNLGKRRENHLPRRESCSECGAQASTGALGDVPRADVPKGDVTEILAPAWPYPASSSRCWWSTSPGSSPSSPTTSTGFFTPTRTASSAVTAGVGTALSGHPAYPSRGIDIPMACPRAHPLLSCDSGGWRRGGRAPHQHREGQAGARTYSADFQKCPGWERRRLRFGSFSSMSMSLVKVGRSSCS